MTLQQALLEAARSPEGVAFETRAGRDEWPYARLLERSARLAGGLRAVGVQPGDRVAVVMATSPDLVATVYGLLLARAVPVLLPVPGRLGRMAEDMASRERMMQAAGARLLLQQAPEEGAPLAEVGTPEDLALLQFSSGTTRDPRPVALTHANIMANCRAILSTLPGRVQDHRCVSWLPLFHDMGLIGGLFTAVAGPGELTLLRPEDFVVRPRAWLEAVSRRRATVSPAPNFALNLCVDRIPDQGLEGLDLSSWQMALVGAEPVQPGTLRRFTERFAPCGFRWEALTPVYGLAEATLAVTFSDVTAPPRVLEVDAEALAAGRVDLRPGGRRVVALGRPLPGLEVEVRPGPVGRVFVRGASVMRGYFGQPEATAEVLRDGWLDTGDLGFLHEGDLYLSGRARDLLIVRGRNHHPEPLEQALHGLEGVSADGAAAFSLESEEQGTEVVCLLVEERRGQRQDPEDLARRARERVGLATGLVPEAVYLVTPGALPRTSSGKIRRAAARAELLEGRLEGAIRAVARR